MPTTTFHLLTEAEAFSEFHGGAISRWVGNVVRGVPNAVVVCPSADASWQLPAESILVLHRLALYRSWRRIVSHLPWFLHGWFLRKLFRPVLKQLRPGDIVWVHNRPEFAIALRKPVQQADSFLVLHLHNAHLVNGPESVMRRVQVDELVFVSRFLLQQAQKKFAFAGSATVIYNGADESIFHPPSSIRAAGRQVTVLFAGRLVEEKGVHVLLEAMTLLMQHHVPLRAQVVGSAGFGIAGETDYIRRLKAASPPTVEFLSYRSGKSLGDLFRSADIFCCPAIWEEPFGLVNVEALASGIPVVATDSGGTGEILADGGGLLVTRDSAVELARALRQLAEDADERVRLGRQGYEIFLRRFTWARVRREVEQVQQILIARQRDQAC